MKPDGMDHVKLVSEKLNVEAISELAASPLCGAVSLFIGTTRDNFEGKEVSRLEYEAYKDMAVKALRNICGEIRKLWPTVENIAIYHRLGCVPVKEASVVIAISSPHRAEAMSATQWCIDNVKKSAPIWKKEVYAGGEAPEWKENKEFECPHSRLATTSDVKQELQAPYVSPHLIQVKATHAEIENRIDKFMERKRAEIDRSNIRDFCRRDPDVAEREDSCARINSVLVKRKDSKGHLRVNRVYNSYSYRDQHDASYLTKHIPQNGVEERVQNLESQLSLTTPTSKDVYARLKALEDRLLHLESISPEYVQFWVQENLSCKPAKRKKVFSLHEIDSYISELETRKANRFVRQ